MTEKIPTYKVNASRLPFLAARRGALRAEFLAGKLDPSVLDPSVRAEGDEDSDPAALGRAYHAAMEQASKEGRDKVSLAETAKRFAVPLRELRDLWDTFAWDPSGFAAEVPYSIERRASHGRYNIVIRGRIDLARVIGEDCAEHVDLKTNQDVAKADSAEESAQIIANGVALWRLYDTPKTRGSLAYVRRGERAWSTCEIDGADDHGRAEDFVFGIAERAIDQLLLEVERKPEAPPAAWSCRVGDDCGWCGGRAFCPLYTRDAKTAVAVFEGGATMELSIDTVPRFHAMAGQLAKAAEALKKACKAFVEEHGPVDIGAGKQLALTGGSPRAPGWSEGLVIEACKELGIDHAKLVRTVDEMRGERAAPTAPSLRIVNKK